MKKNIKYFIGLYLAFLIFGVACDDNCGPFDEKYAVTGLIWEISKSADTTVNYEEFYIYVRPEAAFFNPNRTTSSFNVISKTYACDPVPPETDDRLLNLEITANRNFNAAYPQGVNLVDLFDVDASYLRSGVQNQFSLAEFLAFDRKFPDAMTLRLREAPDAGEPFVFTLKFSIDGTDLDSYEFNTDAVAIAF
jgi:hypothetical protein